MRWSNYDCFWGRPLKSICCLLDSQILNFNYFHLNSSNITYVNGPLEDKEVKIKFGLDTNEIENIFDLIESEE